MMQCVFLQSSFISSPVFLVVGHRNNSSMEKYRNIPEVTSNSKLQEMQLYQEALYCLELLALQLEGNTDYPAVEHLYEKCHEAISILGSIQHNPHIAASLENLLETINFQMSLIYCRPPGFQRTQSDGLIKYPSFTKTVEDSSPRRRPSKRCSESGVSPSVQDMLLPPSSVTDTLEDVIGLEDAKQILYEALIMPARYPQLFQGGAKPWTRLLLYGPPGTGKTRLARAVASELQCPFFYVSAANLLSSWVGESEKLTRDLFQHARKQHSQAIIFFDEIDSLCRKRSQGDDEHSRRVKSELLQQMDGNAEDATSSVFLLGATNCPWDMDPAFLRRFERRIYASLPGREACRAIISKHFSMGPLQLTDSEWQVLLDATEGYSGADLTHLATTAAFLPIRELQSARFWRFTADNKITPCSSDTLGAMQYTLSKLPAHRVVARPVEAQDFLVAASTTPRTVSTTDINRYLEYSQASHHS
ncbi:Vacuolar protein sorting-associated protein 4 [Chionoecetes opilio]|uniref:Vacuolar protein sorting-associated protein 4 n=1 Tax=Chionoecetes opilio TaxID=41210 RepID=A0A8J4YEF9_CHIOP|nr:Vacuolar protein sorting-associated protein 4 [Chionoecetes opilio]